MQPPAPRDFVETAGGVRCAVVAWADPGADVPAMPRYFRGASGAWRRTGARHAGGRGGLCTIAPEDIVRVFRSRDRLAALAGQRERDAMEERAVRMAALLGVAGVPQRAIGVTGSVLLGLHRPGSDLDLTIHGREAFAAAREALGRLLLAGVLEPLSTAEWRRVYKRRAPSVDFLTFLAHESRKQTRALFDGVRVDLTMVSPPPPAGARDAGAWRELGRATLEATVTDDEAAFDYPARFALDHPEVRELLVYTNTYVGQARAGERVSAAGMLERHADGRHRVVIGTSREAPGEHLRVLDLRPGMRGGREAAPVVAEPLPAVLRG